MLQRYAFPVAGSISGVVLLVNYYQIENGRPWQGKTNRKRILLEISRSDSALFQP